MPVAEEAWRTFSASSSAVTRTSVADILSAASAVSSDIPWAEARELDAAKAKTSLVHSSNLSHSPIFISFPPIRVTLEQLYKGDTRSLEISRKVVCQTCNGYETSFFADICDLITRKPRP